MSLPTQMEVVTALNLLSMVKQLHVCLLSECEDRSPMSADVLAIGCDQDAGTITLWIDRELVCEGNAIVTPHPTKPILHTIMPYPGMMEDAKEHTAKIKRTDEEISADATIQKLEDFYEAKKDEPLLDLQGRDHATMDIYQKHDFEDRDDYLDYLAEISGVTLGVVHAHAELLGAEEDFDGLVTEISGQAGMKIVI